MNAMSRFMSMQICLNTSSVSNSKLKPYVFMLGDLRSCQNKRIEISFIFPISATPDGGNVISRDNNTFKWFGIYLVHKIIWED